MKLSFIKLDINIMNDTKIKIIRSMPDGDRILVLWIGILCLGMQSGKAGVLEIGDGIPFTPDTLSAELNIPVNTVVLGLETLSKLKMIELLNDEAIYIKNFEKHQELDKIEIGREKLRLRVAKSREKKKLQLEDNSNTPVTVTDRFSNAIDKEQDKEQDKDKDKDKDKNRNSESFNNFWELYSKKQNKPKCQSKWSKLKQSDKDIIFKTLPGYVKSTPDIKYRKNPLTYLNNEAWNDEIIPPKQQEKSFNNQVQDREIKYTEGF